MSTPASGVGAPNSNPAAAASAAVGSKNDTLTQSDFLQLMVTQMKNQDPTSPTDPSQFLGQLAQMSEVSSLQNMQTTLGSLSTSLLSSQAVNGANLVGHDILSQSSTGTLATGGKVSGAVQVPTGTSKLTVTVNDAAGQLIKTIDVDPTQTGLTGFSWDGTTVAGTPAPSGTYTFNVAATVSGAQQALSPLIETTVQSVTIDQTNQSLNLNTANGVVPLSKVVSIN